MMLKDNIFKENHLKLFHYNYVLVSSDFSVLPF